MGTRSHTHIKAEGGAKICTIYRQMDGYPSGHGRDLFDHFGATQLINGISQGNNLFAFANGMDCFAAAVVASLKCVNGMPRIGRIYLQAPTDDDEGVDYAYTLYQVGERSFDQPAKLHIKCVQAGGEVLYDGPMADFGAFIDKHAA